ncbi:hypothetical protein ABZ192_12645 [Streptomyces sp. NPDC006235]|uniref:hypothetical protein n=1 Tax=Streptomyces sp. NPDC006235 TaxID=3156736 RepID=UPI0033B042B9
MDETQAAEWLKVWRQAQKPGTVVDWLSWLAENGYRVTQGPASEPLPADTVWELASEPSRNDLARTFGLDPDSPLLAPQDEGIDHAHLAKIMRNAERNPEVRRLLMEEPPPETCHVCGEEKPRGDLRVINYDAGQFECKSHNNRKD